MTGTLFQPLELGPTDLELEITGFVRSTLMLLWVELAEFPALSKQVPVTDWPPPSLRVEGGGTLDTPDKTSEQVKLTVTVTLFQPLEFGLADLELAMTGGVLSMLMLVTVAEPVFPALSVHVAVLD